MVNLVRVEQLPEMKVNTTNLPGCKECAIRATALFGELEMKHLDKARTLRSSQLVYEAGEYLYHEGDIPEKAYTVYKGWVILFKDMQDEIGRAHV